MIEVIATSARLAQTMCGCALVGAMLSHYRQRSRMQGPPAPVRHWGIAAGGFLLAGLVTLAAQGVTASGRAPVAIDVALLWQLSQETRFGAVWWMRQALMLVVLMGCWRASRPRLPALAAIAALATALGAASGHAAGLEPAWPAIIALVLHLGALGVWWGGLWPLAGALAKAQSTMALRTQLERFSRLATVAMLIIVGSGTYLAVSHVERWPALFGTRYGHLLLFKLALVALVLGCAARLRWHWMPTGANASDSDLRMGVQRVLRMEYMAACTVIFIATILADTPPGRHEQVIWPFSFRFAPEVAWAQPGNLPPICFGGGALLLAMLLAALSWRYIPRDIGLPGVLGLTLLGGSLLLPALTVPAYSDTYRSSVLPYHAISIASGAALFQQHCAACHGTGGLGDGPLAAGLAKPPADLSSPHTADHTAGDMFWWITHGMAAGAMPAFGASLEEEARWDLINFLRAFASGYQGRILRARVAPGQPWLGAPDFNYSTRTGDNGALRALRNDRAALLVFYSLPYSEARLQALSQAGLPGQAVQLLAIAIDVDNKVQIPVIDLPVVVQGAEETALTYRLLRRTLLNPDAGDRGAMPAHMEMLIDRFGYVRARWLPEESDDWSNIDILRQQIESLNAEPEILPPPDEHIH